jgi:hypothetical protein
MDSERTIDEIEWLERIFAVPDTRPLSPSDLSAANRRHDETHAHSPWIRLWQRYERELSPLKPRRSVLSNAEDFLQRQPHVAQGPLIE